LRDDQLGMMKQNLPCICGSHAPWQSLKKLEPNQSLELAHMAAQGRLRNSELA
jgi:hypothetical protein